MTGLAGNFCKTAYSEPDVEIRGKGGIIRGKWIYGGVIYEMYKLLGNPCTPLRTKLCAFNFMKG